MIDKFYTPEHIALNLLTSLNTKRIKSVADFAVGDGSLIRNLQFKPNEIIGLDIDCNVINGLRASNPQWNLREGDFLNPDEETRQWLSSFQNKLDLIVLNPPFSCKGKKRIKIKVTPEQTIVCRTSLAFVFTALQYLNGAGTLVAILPLSCLKSEADNIVLSYLKDSWDITIGEKLGRGVFKNCTPNSFIITLKRKIKTHNELIRTLPIIKYDFTAQVLRGSTPMFSTLESGRYEVLHTTNLRNNAIINDFKYSNTCTKRAFGTYLCIPRVGKPSKRKIVMVYSQEFVLSDCIIGLKGDHLEQTLNIKKVIFDNWEKFQSLYESTCAPYITLNQLKDFLSLLKIGVEVVLNFNENNVLEKNINNGLETKTHMHLVCEHV